MYICLCSDLRQSQIEEAIQEGARTLEEVQESTTACTGCESCREEIEDMLNRLSFSSLNESLHESSCDDFVAHLSS
jgi:bacterioferritin-associated ferredoxin